MSLDLEPTILSLKMASAASAILVATGVPLARWIALRPGWSARFVRALTQLPMVLPPTVLGFYLLVLLSPSGALGGFLRDHLGLGLLFSFPGLVLASAVSGLPFLVAPAIAGFQSIPPRLREASLCLGRGPWATFWHLEIPLALPSILSGVLLSFLHSLGEFGVVLMIGGKIPGSTQTLSIQLYDLVEQMDFASAHRLAGAMAIVSFLGLVALFALQRTSPSR
ncbi:MAG: molybdate ABC transporter permease subunit [Fibrobacteria bacterium]|nr:molybdate ABC transporter permease subunit [Fibrobacteria bacterium]